MEIRVTLSFMLFFFCAQVVVYGQVERQKDSEEDFGVECEIKNYKFRFGEGEDVEYFEVGEKENKAKKAFVCNKNLPKELTLVDYNSLVPVLAGSFQWKKNGEFISNTSNTVSIFTSDLKSTGEMIIECIYQDASGGEEFSLYLRIINNEIEFSSVTPTALDDNNIKAYQFLYPTPYDEIGSINPAWDFLLKNVDGVEKNLRARIKYAKGENAVYKNNTFDIDDDVGQLEINPNQMNQRQVDLGVSFIYPGAFDEDELISVNCCNESDLVFHVGFMKTVDVNLYTVCESDDDLYVNPYMSTGLSPDAVCIDGGVDGTIDLMYNKGFIDTLSNGRKVDTLVYDEIEKKYYLLAGFDMACTTKKHRHNSTEPHLDCPSDFDVVQEVEYLKEFYALAGIDINFENLFTYNVNFDVEEDDNILEGREYSSFTKKLHEIDGFPTMPEDIYTFLIKELGQSVNNQGQVTTTTLGLAFGGFGGNLLWLNSRRASGVTWAHEIGHAKWSLRHPDDDSENQTGSIVDDWRNFMYSSQNYLGRRTINNIRYYQLLTLRQ